MSSVIRALAPAKLNLALAVGAPNPDGMHPICSWMVAVDLYDDLEVTRLEPDRFSRYAILWHADARRPSEIDWAITKDLAVRAHLALEQHTGRRLPVQLKLEKRIPVGGGLGGGSSDAAAMLHACNELFELGLDLQELAAIAAPLGSDVPFLVHGGSAIVAGLGEQIDRHEQHAPLHAVVMLPDAACPTGEIYRLFDEDIPDRFRDDDVRAFGDGLPTLPEPGRLFNDLAAAAFRAAPALEAIAADVAPLAERPVCVSGSGSSLFVLCDDAQHAEHLAVAIEREHDVPAVIVAATAHHAARSPVVSEARDV